MCLIFGQSQKKEGLYQPNKEGIEKAVSGGDAVRPIQYGQGWKLLETRNRPQTYWITMPRKNAHFIGPFSCVLDMICDMHVPASHSIPSLPTSCPWEAALFVQVLKV